MTLTAANIDQVWDDLIADDIALDIELVKKGGLREFVELAWPHVEPQPFVANWHIDEICAHLEAISRGDIKRLVINVPPGHSKSLIVSVFWPAWWWIHDPKHKWMFATFDLSLARRDALRHRALVRSSWYAERWPHVEIDESPDVQTTQGVFYTTQGGLRFSTTTEGKATGWHADTQVVDDPTKPAEIAKDPDTARAALKRTSVWWRETMATRKANPTRFARVCIMQRLHEDDLAGELRKEGYTALVLPARFEGATKCTTTTDAGEPLGGDRRTVEGDLLNPARYPESELKRLEEIELGAQGAAAQLQQRPAPAEGNIFNRLWFSNRWEVVPARGIWALSIDCNFKDTAKADFVALGVWIYGDAHITLVDRIYARLGLPDTCDRIRTMKGIYRRVSAVVIEDKANGPAVEQVLRKEILGIDMVTPEGGKIARANASAPIFRAGNVSVPSLQWRICPRCGATRRDLGRPVCGAPLKSGSCDYSALWVGDYIENMVGFPFAANDDDVDMTTQIILYFNASSADLYALGVKAMLEQARR